MTDKIIWGVISADGQPAGSSGGFEVEKGGAGVYRIQFTKHFSVLPAVVATQLYPNSPSPDGGDTRDNAVVAYINHQRCRIVTGQDDGSRVDRDFSFIAIGTVNTD
jgi:hypothetical protein